MYKYRAPLMLFFVLAVAFAMSAGSPAARAQTFSVIHTFTGTAIDGRYPGFGVTLRGGNLYGTTNGNGYGDGTVFQMTRQGDNWVLVPLYIFSGPDGSGPYARVVFGPDGHLYGTAGGGTLQNGVVFQLTPPLSICKTAGCYWKETVLHNFASGDDGADPGYGDLIFDFDGNIYGVTSFGAAQGTVFQLQQSGNTWTENILYSFGFPPDGGEPFGGLIFDQNGNLWGTTAVGGNFVQYGTVFELMKVGAGWQELFPYSFRGANDGAYPIAGLISDSSCNFYGTTSAGGSAGGGTVFELTPSGNGWTLYILYSFSGNNGGPFGPLTMDAAGNLYGITGGDGAYALGNVFKLTHTGNSWVYTSLHDFTGGADGEYPLGNVTIDTDGTLYGTAAAGGSVQGNCAPVGCGTVWMIKP